MDIVTSNNIENKKTKLDEKYNEEKNKLQEIKNLEKKIIILKQSKNKILDEKLELFNNYCNLGKKEKTKEVLIDIIKNNPELINEIKINKEKFLEILELKDDEYIIINFFEKYFYNDLYEKLEIYELENKDSKIIYYCQKQDKSCEDYINDNYHTINDEDIDDIKKEYTKETYIANIYIIKINTYLERYLELCGLKKGYSKSNKYSIMSVDKINNFELLENNLLVNREMWYENKPYSICGYCTGRINNDCSSKIHRSGESNYLDSIELYDILICHQSRICKFWIGIMYQLEEDSKSGIFEIDGYDRSCNFSCNCNDNY